MKLSDTSKMNSRVADMGHITQCFIPCFLKTLSCLYTYSNSIRRRASPTLLIFFPKEFYDSITPFHFIFLLTLSLGLGKEWQIGGEFKKSDLCLFWQFSFPLRKPVSLQTEFSLLFSPEGWPPAWANPAVAGGVWLSIFGLRYQMHFNLIWSSVFQTKLDQQ